MTSVLLTFKGVTAVIDRGGIWRSANAAFAAFLQKEIEGRPADHYLDNPWLNVAKDIAERLGATFEVQGEADLGPPGEADSRPLIH